MANEVVNLKLMVDCLKYVKATGKLPTDETDVFAVVGRVAISVGTDVPQTCAFLEARSMIEKNSDEVWSVTKHGEKFLAEHGDEGQLDLKSAGN